MLKQGVVPNRPHDYIYDNTFTVPGKVDHIKQMNRSQAQQIIINPHFGNMFSALRHYPAMHYNLKTNPFPSGIGQDRRTIIEPMNVAQNRFKYFKRPITLVPIFGGQIVYSKTKQKIQPIQEPKIELDKKTIGIQTMYRDSQAQTSPFSPDYICKPNQNPPEILALGSLVYGNGLPAGICELEMIERARQKRVWEQSLPVVTDTASFEKRLKMMEEMELKEWQEREMEIKKLQNERLIVLEKLVRERELEMDLETDKKVQRIWQKKMQQRQLLLENIEKKRNKALRTLQDQRQKVDVKIQRRDIIHEYSNYGSQVYAPKARNGVFLDNQSTTLVLDIPETSNYQGLIDLEKRVPNSFFEPHLEKQIHQKQYLSESRRQRQLKEQLEQMTFKLKERKLKVQEEPIKYAVRIEKEQPRPPTPVCESISIEQQEMHIAAHLLQNFIRGRFVQMQMYKNKQRRLDLINELKTRHVYSKLKMEMKSDPKMVENEGRVRFESIIQAEYVGKTLDFLTKELTRLRQEQKIASIVSLAQKTRTTREISESISRQQQLEIQSLEQQKFIQIMNIQQETVDSFLNQLIQESIHDKSCEQARLHVQDYANQTSELFDTADYNTVSDLVTCFLIPNVEKNMLRNQDQQQYLKAAHDAVYQELQDLESELSVLEIQDPNENE